MSDIFWPIASGLIFSEVTLAVVALVARIAYGTGRE